VVAVNCKDAILVLVYLLTTKYNRRVTESELRAILHVLRAHKLCSD
jgi:hypothetical protein